MSNDYNFGNSSQNPYASPTGFSHLPPPNQPSTGKIMAPGIALIVVGALGLIASVFNVIFALVVEPQVDPNAPEFVRQMQAGAAGPMTAVIQAVCVFMNLFIIFGGVQMARVSMWGVDRRDGQLRHLLLRGGDSHRHLEHRHPDPGRRPPIVQGPQPDVMSSFAPAKERVLGGSRAGRDSIELNLIDEVS